MISIIFFTNTWRSSISESLTDVQDGASAIARGLARNTTLESINLMNQTHSRWGDKCLDDFLEMFNYNMTLLKVEFLSCGNEEESFA
jgi:hypothetical protein